MQATVDKLNAVLADKPSLDKKVKAKLRYVTKEYPKKITEYERKEQVLGERNSFSKTDPDSTFMRMKEDHMKNWQLKPSYNVQISTSNQLIVNYTIHPNPTDTRTLSAHLAQHRESYGKPSESLTADSGYGSEENFQLLENLQVEAFVKYGLFDKQQKSSYQKQTRLCDRSAFL